MMMDTAARAGSGGRRRFARDVAGALRGLFHAARNIWMIIVLLLIWQFGVMLLKVDPLSVPSPLKSVKALIAGVASGEILRAIEFTLRMIGQGFIIGFCIAIVVAGLAASSELGRAFMDALVTVFNPLPAVALLPLAMLWFGLGTRPLIFVIVMSVAWPAAISLHSGFSSVPLSLRRVGENYGFSGLRQFLHIYLPASLPSVLSAFRIAWAFAWRTAIAAEMVFGVSGSQGGLGYYIYVSRYNLDTADVFAGLMAIVIIGIVVERGILGMVERRTTVRWGVTR